MEAPPSAPDKIEASDGTFPLYVRVNWEGSTEASRYRVFRNTTPSFRTSKELTDNQHFILTKNLLADGNVDPGRFYFYWIIAENEAGEKSLVSRRDSGFIPALSPIAMPLKLAPLEGQELWSNAIFEWSKVAGAQSYRLQLARGVPDRWNTQNGFPADQLVIDTIINDNRLAILLNQIDQPGLHYWTVQASGAQASYFSPFSSVYLETQEDIFTLPNPNRSIGFKNTNINQNNDKLQVQCSVQNKSTEGIEKLHVHYFLSQDEVWDKNDALLHTELSTYFAPDMEQTFTSTLPAARRRNAVYLVFILEADGILLPNSQKAVSLNQ